MSGEFHPNEIYPLFHDIEKCINKSDAISKVSEKIFEEIKKSAPKTISEKNLQFQTCGFDENKPRISVNFMGKIEETNVGRVRGQK